MFEVIYLRKRSGGEKGVGEEVGSIFGTCETAEPEAVLPSHSRYTEVYVKIIQICSPSFDQEERRRP